MRANDRTVKGTVRVAKMEAGRNAAFDEELTAMLRPVMRATKNDETVGVVVAAL